MRRLAGSPGYIMFPTLSFGRHEFAPRDLAAHAAKAAGFLASIGLRDGDTIALMLRNDPALVEIMLAARQLGTYFVPLNWHFKASEAGHILRDSGAKILIVHSDLLRAISDGIPADMPVFEIAPLVADGGADLKRGPVSSARGAGADWLTAVAHAEPLEGASQHVRGMVAYTSGTTGLPKGVRRFTDGDGAEAARRIGEMHARALGIVAGARCLISAPLYHSAPIWCRPCSFACCACRRRCAAATISPP
jgi:long-chain acyl-CoA synthetase